MCAATPMDSPRIVCLCGSTRFAHEFAAQNLRLTLDGVIVLSIGAAVSDRELGITQQGEVKRQLDELHLRKIDLADSILVLNVGGYVGSSTAREIAYARGQGKPVVFLEPLETEGAGAARLRPGAEKWSRMSRSRAT